MAITKQQQNRAIIFRLLENFLFNLQKDSSLRECIDTLSMQWGEDENIVRPMVAGLRGDFAYPSINDILKNKDIKDTIDKIIQDLFIDFFGCTVNMIREDLEYDRESEERCLRAAAQDSTYRIVIVDGIEYKLVPVRE